MRSLSEWKNLSFLFFRFSGMNRAERESEVFRSIQRVAFGLVLAFFGDFAGFW